MGSNGEASPVRCAGEASLFKIVSGQGLAEEHNDQLDRR